jgi:hypothetical protein
MTIETKMIHKGGSITLALRRLVYSIVSRFPLCCDSAGALFLCFAYGYLLLVGANLISDGSELLLEVIIVAYRANPELFHAVTFDRV